MNANYQLLITSYGRTSAQEYSLIDNRQSTIDNSLRASVPSCRRLPRKGAFSLVEMMIAIIILGLGLVMVATIFPVAWDRARTLSEYTVQQSAAAGAHTTLAALLRPAGHSLVQIKNPVPTTPPFEELRLTAGSLAGDMFFDPTLPSNLPPNGRYLAVLSFSDTSVHALNMENMLITPDNPGTNPLGLVAENPWDLEDPGGSFPTPPTQIVQGRFVDPRYPGIDPEPEKQRNRGRPFPDQFFYGGDNYLTPQVRVWQRLYPPMEAPPSAAGPELDQWNEKLATRRFCWAVLHRLRSRVGPMPLPTGVPVLPAESDRMVREAAAAMGSTRTFDMYYVTLRRPRSTNRYARQDPAQGIPDPFTLSTVPVEPKAKVAEDDVMFPVAWRVQIQLLPNSLALAATGIPTEVPVPPTNITGETARMLVQMFPVGTQFIDEITGNIYRVAKRRIVDDEGRKSVLTLDREIVVEDFDLPPGDPRCDTVVCVPGTLVAEELLRTVWVFPPPVDRSQSDPGPTPQFDGPSPVVEIEVGALSISPS